MDCIYTAIAGDYDRLPSHVEIPGVDFIVFTDIPREYPGWQVRPIVPQPDVHPRMVAKRYKLLPHRVLPEYDRSIWVDGCHVVHSPQILRAFDYVNHSGLALHDHPWRDCIYEEAAASLELDKYRGQPIVEQVEHYRSNGHPEHWGLWACGTLARLHDQCRGLMEAWWDENQFWSYQDQLSLPWLFRNRGITPGVFPHHQVFNNPWVNVGAHRTEQ